MKRMLLLGFVLCVAGAAAPRPLAAVLQSGKVAASLHYQDGVRHVLAGRLGEAAAAFEQAVQLDPKNADAHFNLGNIYSEWGRWEDAVAAYRKTLALKPKDGEAYNNLGLALAARGEYERAAGAFERASEIYPKWAEPRYHLGHAYQKMGHEVAARVAHAEALERRPDYATQPPRSFTSRLVQARAEPRGEKPSAAANGATPNGAGANGAGANGSKVNDSAARRADDEAARRAAETADRAARPDPENVAARPVERVAERVAERAAAPPPVSPYELGQRHSRAGRHEEAAAAYRQAVALDRDDARAYTALGGAYAQLGRWRESVEAYEHAARLDPRDATVYEMLGRSYAKLRETAPAPTATAAPAPTAPARDAAAASSAATPAAASPSRTGGDPTEVYRVGPGDVLEVLVPNVRELRSSVHAVTPAGLLDYPRAGEPFNVEGLTTDEIASLVSAGLRRRGVTAPQVSIGVREYVSHAIIIGGMVKDPGTKILRREGVPLYVIVAHAQPQPGAGQALVTSKATGRTTAVNLADADAMKTLVRPGDVVTVQPLPKQFYYVAGAVRQPGQREFHVGLTLTQALLAAGGVQPSGASTVSIMRQAEDGRLVTTRHSLREIEAGRTQDPTLRPGDRVEVVR